MNNFSRDPAFVVLAAGVFSLTLLIAVAIARAKARREKEAARRQGIYDRYGYTDVAENIIHQRVWMGETADQLRESLGLPQSIDEKVFRTNRRETWKYGRTGVNRFAFRCVLENEVVIGWDNKG